MKIIKENKLMQFFGYSENNAENELPFEEHNQQNYLNDERTIITINDESVLGLRVSLSVGLNKIEALQLEVDFI